MPHEKEREEKAGGRGLRGKRELEEEGGKSVGIVEEEEREVRRREEMEEATVWGGRGTKRVCTMRNKDPHFTVRVLATGGSQAA